MKGNYVLYCLLVGSIPFTSCHSAKPNKTAGKIYDTAYVVFTEDSANATEYVVHGKDTIVCTSVNPSTEYWEKQNAKFQNTSVQTIGRIFIAYTRNSDGIESHENKDTMKIELSELQLLDTINERELPLLINVWMYYDPTDFDVRKLILPIFQNNRNTSIIAVRNRLKHKKKWESVDSAPYSDLVQLEKDLERESKK